MDVLVSMLQKIRPRRIFKSRIISWIYGGVNENRRLTEKEGHNLINRNEKVSMAWKEERIKKEGCMPKNHMHGNNMYGIRKRGRSRKKRNQDVDRDLKATDLRYWKEDAKFRGS